ncbi:PilZ domain-containing protein [Geomobilimonas luticola]|uniref:PilZ domain-containing protein n=1 Tax=Geomobilimonas luticola TaxID=1114878 RepID=A0ABS5SAU7_9BACT|nr:PilZ domain-containing protein [Geomobilimonas luticola]MBT0651767.1 PilZ domain-containing protein [Geomobilimonas luticola]
METPDNKRHNSRTPFHQPVGLEIWEQGAEHVHDTGRAIDLSADGGGLATKYPLKRGDVVKLLVPVGVTNVRLPVYASVVWSKVTDDGFRAGVTFLA